MKSVTLEIKGLTLEALLAEAVRTDVVFLTSAGETRFAFMPADDGDQEVSALKSNAEFMAYLTDCERQAAERPGKSLREVQEKYRTTPARRRRGKPERTH